MTAWTCSDEFNDVLGRIMDRARYAMAAVTTGALHKLQRVNSGDHVLREKNQLLPKLSQIRCLLNFPDS